MPVLDGLLFDGAGRIANGADLLGFGGRGLLLVDLLAPGRI